MITDSTNRSVIELLFDEPTPSLNEMLRKHWTAAEDQILRSEYPNFRVLGKISELAKRIGRTTAAVHLRASRLGLGKRTHPKQWANNTPEELAHFSSVHNTMSDAELGKFFGLSVSGVQKRRTALGIRKDQGLRWKHTPHPKGFLGGRHSALVKSTQSSRAKAMWRDPNHVINSEQHRQLRSDRSSKLQAEGKFRNRYSKGNMGSRADLGGQYFRSSWEANYARYLNFLKMQGQLEKWEYEPDTFWFHKIKRGSRSYTPDFKIWESGKTYYDEVKGWMDQRSKTKLKRMALYYPEIEIRLVEHKQYKEISRKLGALIPHWEFKGKAGTRVQIEAA